MIPRLHPYYDSREFHVPKGNEDELTQEFEERFAQKVGRRYAVSFMYGRMALLAILKALEIKDREVILPAYTCAVVAHAVVLSGNTPVFVDLAPDEVCMDMNQVLDKINTNTGAVIATHMYGHVCDTEPLGDFEKNKGIVIHDWALSLESGDASNESKTGFYSLNPGKHMSMLKAGVAVTDDKQVYEKLIDFRKDCFTSSNPMMRLKNQMYFLLHYVAFNPHTYSVVHYLAHETNALDSLVKYYDERTIELPKDAYSLPSKLQYQIGIAQLKKCEEIIAKRNDLKQKYDMTLLDKRVQSKKEKEACLSHYCLRVKNRDQFKKNMKTKGIEVGELFDYIVPGLHAYKKYVQGDPKDLFPNAFELSQEIVNLPFYPSLSNKDASHVVQTIEGYFSE